MPDPDASRSPDGVLIGELYLTTLAPRKIHYVIPKDNHLRLGRLVSIIIEKGPEVGEGPGTLKITWPFSNRKQVLEGVLKRERGRRTRSLPGQGACL